MKKNHFIALFLLLTAMGYSQMPAAQMLPPNSEKRITINATASAVWTYLVKGNNVAEFGSKIIKKATLQGKGLNALREIVFNDDHKRSEEIIVIDPDIRRMGIRVVSLPKELSRYVYYFEVQDKGNTSCVVSLKAYFGLTDESAKSKIKKEIVTEFAVLLDGLKQTLESKKG